MSHVLVALIAAQAHASNLEPPADTPVAASEAPQVIRVQAVAPSTRAVPSGPTGCGPRFQAPSGLTVLPLSDGEYQTDGRYLCSWLVTAHGVDALMLGVLTRGEGSHDSVRVLRADGTEVTHIDAMLTPEQAVLQVPSTVVLELRVRTLDTFDGVYTRLL
jgi:hypothetical protein